MESKKRSKGRGWESCCVKKMYGTFGVEMRAYGQKLVKFCKHTDASKLVVEIPSWPLRNNYLHCDVDVFAPPITRSGQFKQVWADEIINKRQLL